MRAVAFSAVALAVSVLAPAAGAAPPRFVQHGDEPIARVTASPRYAGYLTSTGVRVIDTRTGVTRDVAPPEERCSFVDVGGGQVLWECGARARYTGGALTDLQTGEVRFLPDESGAIRQEVTAVGAHWVSGWRSGNHYTGAPYYQRWRAASASGRSDDSPPPERLYPDLDHPDLARPMCKPLKRPRDPSYSDTDGGDEFLPYQYERRFGLHTRLVDHTWHAVLARCGKRKPQRFAAEHWIELRSGLITWVTKDKVRGYVPRTGRRFSWPIRDIDPRAVSADVTHTTTTVLVTTTDRAGNDSLYTARWRPAP
jgi:hypothetical protein